MSSSVRSFGAKGDGVADDTAALQRAVDAAPAVLTVPRGVYRTTASWIIHGRDVRIECEPGATLLIDFHNDETGKSGIAIWMKPLFDDTFAAAGATGDTLTFAQSVPFSAGETLFVTQGPGACLPLEQANGGQATMFNELAPCEHVRVLAINGATVTLARPLLGTYTAPQVRRFTTPCERITLSGLSIAFADPLADMAFMAHYAHACRVADLAVLGEPTLGTGGLCVVGSTACAVERVSCLARGGIGLNSSRACTVRDSHASQVTLEEASTDNLVTGNMLRGPGVGIRTGDTLCVRNIFASNRLLGHGNNALAFWEGSANLIFGNVSDGVLWAGRPGNLMAANLAAAISDYTRGGNTAAANRSN